MITIWRNDLFIFTMIEFEIYGIRIDDYPQESYNIKLML